MVQRVTIVVVILSLLTAGCARYRFSGERLERGQPRRTGVVIESFSGYFPIEARRFPTTTVPFLKVMLRKRLEVAEEYAQDAHRERILKRQKSKAEAYWIVFAEMLGLSLYLGDPTWKILMPATVLAISAVPGPKPDYRYERIQGSDTVEVSNRSSFREVPAPGETLQIQGSAPVRTDENGIATVPVRPEQWDTGITLKHIESGTTYFLCRIRHEREVRKDWVRKAKTISNIVGFAVTVVKMGKMVATGVGAGAIVVAAVIDLLTGALIGYLFEEVTEDIGTKTVSYYEWVFVQRQ